MRVRSAGDAWYVEADVPGVEKESISIEYFRDQLSIRYERSEPDATLESFDDRNYGRFERIVRVAGDIDVDSIEAKLTAGVLTIRMPKSQISQPKRLHVIGG